jgi:NAD(P)-dependent dehydrogenase (short-subunit alcohol dehydrogenase family)
MSQAIEELKSKGIEKLDIVIANAGLIDLTPEAAEEVWRINVRTSSPIA